MAATYTTDQTISSSSLVFDADLAVGRGQLGRSGFISVASAGTATHPNYLWNILTSRPTRYFINADTITTNPAVFTLPEVGASITQAQVGHVIFIKNVGATRNISIVNYSGSAIATINAANNFAEFVAVETSVSANRWTLVNSGPASASVTSTDPEIKVATRDFTVINDNANTAQSIFTIGANESGVMDAPILRVFNSQTGQKKPIITGFGNLSLPGSGITTSANKSIAIGYQSAANASNAIALGDYAIATSNYGLALGNNSTADTNCVAIGSSDNKGEGARATGSSSSTLITFATESSGNYKNGSISRYFFINTYSRRYYVWFSGTGGGTDPAPSNAISISVPLSTGDTDITIVNSCTTSINATKDITANNLVATLSIILVAGGNPGSLLTDFNITVTNGGPLPDASFNFSSSSGTTITNGIAIGNNATTSANNGISIGRITIASGDNSVSVGNSTTASGSNSILIGSSSIVSGIRAIGIGRSITNSQNACLIISDGESAITSPNAPVAPTNRAIFAFDSGFQIIGKNASNVKAFTNVVNNAPSMRISQSQVLTTTATTTVLLSVPMVLSPTTGSIMTGIRGNIIGANTTTPGATWMYDFLVSAKNIANTLTVGTNITNSIVDDATTSITFTASGTTLNINVVTTTAVNRTWNITAELYELRIAV